jgi:outer membrane protein OmpU
MAKQKKRTAEKVTAKVAVKVAVKVTAKVTVAKLHHPPRLCCIAAPKSCQNRPERAKPLCIPMPDSPVWAYELKTEGKTMKKVLFATTALIATAGMAAAEVRISGYGRFGLDYNSANNAATNGVSKTTLTSRLRLQFDMSTETDNGIAMGARYRIQAESRDNTPGTGLANGGRFYVSSNGFTLQVGNIIGAVENMSGLYLETRTADIGVDGAGFESNIGNVNSEAFNWDSYSSGGTGVNGVEVLWSAGDFKAHVSYSARNRSAPFTTVGTARTAANVAYTFGDWTAALAMQSSNAMWEDKVLVSLSGNLGQFGVRVAYADNDGIGKWGLYGNMDVGSAGNLVAYVTDEQGVSAADVLAGRNDNRDAVVGSNAREGTGYGINYSYDLGGGASFEAGARRASNGNDTAQAGVYFSF